MKKLEALIVILLFCVLFYRVAASDESESKPSNPPVIEKTTINNITNNTSNNKYSLTGQALSLGAASIDCSSTSRRWQGGVGLGYIDDNVAPVAGICKKFNSTLIKFTIGWEGKSTGGNFGIMFPLN